MPLIAYLLLISFILFLLASFGFFIFSVLFFQSIIKGAPYVPIKNRALKKMIELAAVKPGQFAADLGSGDGRIIVALARAGAIAYGYEINPILVWWSRRKIKKENLAGKAFICQKSFWDEDLSGFNVIALFGIRKIMKELGEKLDRELKPGAKVISYGFSFPDWQYSKKEEAVFLYEKK